MKENQKEDEEADKEESEELDKKLKTRGLTITRGPNTGCRSETTEKEPLK